MPWWQISCQEGLKSANEALRISEESGDRRGQAGLRWMWDTSCWCIMWAFQRIRRLLWWPLVKSTPWMERKTKQRRRGWFFFAVTDRTCYRALQFGHARLIGCWLSVKSYLNLSHPFISFRFAMIFNIAFYRTPGTVTRAVCTQVSGHRSEDPRSSEWRCCTVPCLVCGV